MKTRTRKRRLYRGIINKALSLFPQMEAYVSWSTGSLIVARFTKLQCLRTWTGSREASRNPKIKKV